ncbi:MAG: TatD family hydrolase [Bacteroidaceae bacterium]|nr:TatD family hydrolase [Bacteroidaceae bacterium]
MIDTHSHIYGSEFDEDRDLVVARAKEIGVEAILLPNINVASMQPMLELCRQYPGYCYPMLGLHPEDVKEDYAEVLSMMKQNLLCAHPYICLLYT